MDNGPSLGKGDIKLIDTVSKQIQEGYVPRPQDIHIIHPNAQEQLAFWAMFPLYFNQRRRELGVYAADHPFSAANSARYRGIHPVSSYNITTVLLHDYIEELAGVIAKEVKGDQVAAAYVAADILAKRIGDEVAYGFQLVDGGGKITGYDGGVSVLSNFNWLASREILDYMGKSGIKNPQFFIRRINSRMRQNGAVLRHRNAGKIIDKMYEVAQQRYEGFLAEMRKPDNAHLFSKLNAGDKRDIREMIGDNFISPLAQMRAREDILLPLDLEQRVVSAKREVMELARRRYTPLPKDYLIFGNENPVVRALADLFYNTYIQKIGEQTRAAAKFLKNGAVAGIEINGPNQFASSLLHKNMDGRDNATNTGIDPSLVRNIIIKTGVNISENVGTIRCLRGLGLDWKANQLYASAEFLVATLSDSMRGVMDFYGATSQDNKWDMIEDMNVREWIDSQIDSMKKELEGSKQGSGLEVLLKKIFSPQSNGARVL